MRRGIGSARCAPNPVRNTALIFRKPAKNLVSVKLLRPQARAPQKLIIVNTVLFVAAPTLVAQLAKAHSEGRLEDRLTHFGKPKLLIVDELGYLPFEPNAAHLFFQQHADHQQRSAP